MRKFRGVYPEVRNEYLELIKKDIIYNYIDKDSIIEKSRENINVDFDKNAINFVTVARLVPQKAIDRLIEVHSKLIEENYIHQFYVIGEGPEQENLKKMVKERHIEKTFHLLGKRTNPYPYIKQADYFCLLSNFEGYGMVLEEAKILGKKIIIPDTAAREAVEKYKNSIVLENNLEKIYEGLKDVIRKPHNEIEEDITEQYDNSKILEKVEKLLNNEEIKAKKKRN